MIADKKFLLYTGANNAYNILQSSLNIFLIAFNTLCIFQQYLKTFQEFTKAFQQIIFIFNIASKQFNDLNCSTINKTIQHLNYCFQQYGKAIQQRHIFSTIVSILSTIRYNCSIIFKTLTL